MNRTVSRRILSVGKHRSTTANIASLYPFAVQAPLPAVGPLLGWNLSAGGAALAVAGVAVYLTLLLVNLDGAPLTLRYLDYDWSLNADSLPVR